MRACPKGTRIRGVYPHLTTNTPIALVWVLPGVYVRFPHDFFDRGPARRGWGGIHTIGGGVISVMVY
jgi:hypothetical protein